MDLALDEARRAAARGEIPVGAVIVDPETQTVVAKAGNRTRVQPDPTGHAEMIAIRAAAETLGRERLTGLDIYVTLEPCAMCAGAIAHARLARVYFGADDPKSGGVSHGARVFSHPQCHHVPDVYSGMGASEAEGLLKAFFKRKR